MEFLKRCQAALSNEKRPYTRNNPPPAYIIVIQEVDDGIKPAKKHVQTLTMTKESYEEFFTDAGLTIYASSEMLQLRKTWLPVMMWALY